MDAYVCKRCGYQASQKSNLQNHLLRKTVCEATYSDICRDQLLNHLRKLPHRNKSRNYVTPPENGSFTKVIDLEAQISQLKEQLEAAKRCQISQTNVNSTVNNIQNVTVNLTNVCDFGKERLDHLEGNFKFQCLKTRNQGVLSLIKEIHFNPDVPENHNVKTDSKKKRTMKIIENGKWVQSTDKFVIIRLFQKIKDIFLKELNTHININDRDYKDLLEWMNLMVEYEDKFKYQPPWVHNLYREVNSLISSYTQQIYHKQSMIEIPEGDSIVV